jgi:hypothetical protein
MAYKRTKRRGGEKKKALLSEVYIPDSPDEIEDLDEFGEMLKILFKDLETYLIEVEEISKAILKAHDLPTNRREILPFTDNYDLPINVSYAVDILFSVCEVREFIKKRDATNAAAAGIRLGRYVARAEAESVAGNRESGRTSNARYKKEAKPKARRERMAAIAKEEFKWKPGMTLTGTQRRAVNTALMLEYKPSDRPTSQDMSNDALILGFRRKK